MPRFPGPPRSPHLKSRKRSADSWTNNKAAVAPGGWLNVAEAGMKIEVERRQDWTILTLQGDLDLDAGPVVYLQFERELLQGRTRFLFDLGGVDIVDSFGLGVLVRCYRDVRSRGGEICLREVPPPISRILEFTRLDSIIPIAALGFDPAALGAGGGTGLRAA